MITGKYVPRLLSQSFSSSASSGGRGRGRGAASTSNFVAQPRPPQNPNSPDSPPEGLGHGRPLPSSFSSFLHAIGRGIPSKSTHPPSPPQLQRSHPPIGESPDSAQDRNLPTSILSVLGGAGRGGRSRGTGPGVPAFQEENRHLRARPSRSMEERFADEPPVEEEMSHSEKPMSRKQANPEEAKRRAMEILSRGEGGGGGGGRGRATGGGRGGRLRDFGAGGRGRGRGRREDVDDDGYADGLYLGDNVDGEKLAQKVGPEMMNELTESFEEITSRVLPSPMDDAYLDAFHTNLMV